MSEETVKLEIKYIAKESGAVETKTLQYNKEELIAASDYFAIQFSGRFVNRKVCSVDLTSMMYPLSSQCIEFTFDYVTKRIPPRILYADSIHIKMTPKIDNPPQDKYTYIYDDIFIERTGIKNYYGIVQLAGYFMFEGLVDSLCASAERFVAYMTQIANVSMHKELESNGLLRMKMQTHIVPGMVRDENEMLSHFIEIKQTILRDEILDDILSAYIFFLMTNKLYLFDNIVMRIRSVITFDVTASINKISIENYHIFLRKIRYLAKFRNSTFKLFDYSDLLSYESHEIVGTLKQTPEKLMQLVRTQSNFDAAFKSRTKDLFSDFCWADVVIIGEFLYDILNDTNEAHTIDLLCKVDAVERINDHFEKFAPIRIFKANMEIIIIKSLDLHVRLFPTDVPRNIAINYFEFGHTMIFYDGTNVLTNIPGLTSIKYGITFRVNELSTTVSVMYKGTHGKQQITPTLVKKVLMGLDATETELVLESFYPGHDVYVVPQTATYDAKLCRFALNNIGKVRDGYKLLRIDSPNEHVKRYKLMFCDEQHQIKIRTPKVSRISNQRAIICLKKETVLELLTINNFIIDELRYGKKKFIWSQIFTIDPVKESCIKGQRANDYHHVYDPNAKYYMTIDIKCCEPCVRHRFREGNTEFECYAVVHDCGSTRGVQFYLSNVK